MSHSDDADAVDLALRACQARRIDPSGLELIHQYSNAVVLVPAVKAVARVATGRHDVDQIRRSLRITGWLRDRGFPTVTPFDDLDVVDVAPHVTVSFWDYLPQPDTPEPFDAADLASLLARLHSLQPPRHDLAGWEPLSSLEDALAGRTSDVLTSVEHRWISERLADIRDRLRDRDWPLGMGFVHGDAWLGNLMTGSTGPVLGDWDRVGWGPREIDLVPTWHATRRYRRDPTWTQRFAAVYGYDLATSPHFEDLMAMRDLAQLPGPLRRAPHSEPHAKALRQRLGDLIAGDLTSSWVAL
jgi:hypothetical protein